MSRITGLLRESIMARLFGAGLIYDAFLLGFRIPNLTRDLFAEGALSSAFVPTFTEYLTKRGKREAAQLANLVGTALIVIVGDFATHLGIPTILMGFGLPDDGLHSPNEKYKIANYYTGIMTIAHFLEQYGQ